MKLTRGHAGTCVSWTIPPHTTVTVRITSVTSDGVGTVGTDGVRELQPTSWAIDLDDISARWRPATPDETAEFNRLYRPAPANWH